jgi:hypothetical protein
MIRHLLKQQGAPHHAIAISNFTRESRACAELGDLVGREIRTAGEQECAAREIIEQGPQRGRCPLDYLAACRA